ncbi:MAG: hypothetical protein HY331_00525 [Chloroflexi bacterium]|nr:hypothetical protein [Chloroflexota bacterium]
MLLLRDGSTSASARLIVRPAWCHALLLVLAAGIATYPLAGLLVDGYRTLPEHVARFLFAFLWYLAACAVVLRLPPRRGTLVVVLGVAVALRLLMVATTPSLSSDVYRYVWEGKLVNLGVNPYQLAPEAPALAPHRDAIWELVNHKHLISPYPPLALGYYAVVYRLWPDSVRAMQMGAALLDLGVAGALALLLRAVGLPAQRLLIYAWSPLPLAAFAHSAHNDPLMVAPLVLAVALVSPVRSEPAGPGAEAPTTNPGERRFEGPATLGNPHPGSAP